MTPFSFPTIVDCGLFDSRSKFGEGLMLTEDRPVDCFELELFAEDGGCTTYLNGQEYTLRSGQFLCTKPGDVRHSRLPFRCYYLHLAETEGALQNMLETLPVVLEAGNLSQYTELFLKIVHASLEDTVTSNCLLYGSMLQILYLLQQDVPCSTALRDPLLDSHREALNRVTAHIQAHLGQRILLRDLADVAHLSPIYFHKLFSLRFGKTPYQYIAEMRITAAKDMLLTTEKPLGDIAAACGFSTQSYFHNQFKAAVGQTPREYRNQYWSRREV